MPISKVTATLVGSDKDDGAVQFGDFRSFYDSLAKCLDRVETKFTERPSKPLRYRIVDLSSGSACMTLEPIPRADGHDVGPEVVKLFSQTVADIQNGRSVDPRFTNDDLKQFRSLVSGINRNLKEIRIDPYRDYVALHCQYR